MSSIDCHNVMKKFHSQEVNLSNKQQDEMHDRRNAGRIRLKNGLVTNDYPAYRDIKSQGSYQMRTMVQDSDNEYDIDDGVYFRPEDLTDDRAVELTPKEARERVCDALKWDGRLKIQAEVKKNCVRQEYPEGYHIDYPVYREVEGGYELASGNEWVDSNAQEVTRWFSRQVNDDLTRGQEDTSQLRRLVKLTKKYSRRTEWKNKTTSGIAITKLVVDHYVFSKERDDIALQKTWQSINNTLKDSTAIKHPVTIGNITEENDEEVEFFNSCLEDSLGILTGLDDPYVTEKEALKIWDEVFNTNFFESQYKENEKDTTLSKVNNDSVVRAGSSRFG